MSRRPSFTTLLVQHNKATTTSRGTPRQRMLNGEWFDFRFALLNAAPYDRVKAAFLDSVRRKAAAKRDAILREMESLEGGEQREYVLRTFAAFRPVQR